MIVLGNYFKLDMMINMTTAMKVINTPSTIQSFFRLRIKRLNMRSEIKKIKAESRENQANIEVTST